MLDVLGDDRSLPAAARRYAVLGVPVFPCVPGGKQPLSRHGFHDATTSVAIVDEWWRRQPEANIGLPTGEPSGVVVVDVDVHGEATGLDAFERSRAAGLTERWACLVRTPSGGLHAYYPARPDSEQRSWQAPGAHVDFRGDGGYIIAPPSRIETVEGTAGYRVIAVAREPGRPIDAVELRNFLEPPRRPAPDLGSPLIGSPTIGSQPDRLAAWVAARPEGGRNGGLFWAACRMVEGAHEYAEAVALLGAAAQSAGLPEHEAEATIRSAYRIASRLSPPTTAGRLDPTPPNEGIAM